MKLYIPEIGDKITLTADWRFQMTIERRNDVVTQYFLKLESFRNSRDGEKFEIIIPAGTVLTIDRIYIRKGVSDFSSITFYIYESIYKDLKKARFWASLTDVNKIEYEIHTLKEKIEKIHMNVQKYCAKELISDYYKPHFEKDISMLHDVRPKKDYKKAIFKVKIEAIYEPEIKTQVVNDNSYPWKKTKEVQVTYQRIKSIDYILLDLNGAELFRGSYAKVEKFAEDVHNNKINPKLAARYSNLTKLLKN